MIIVLDEIVFPNDRSTVLGTAILGGFLSSFSVQGGTDADTRCADRLDTGTQRHGNRCEDGAAAKSYLLLLISSKLESRWSIQAAQDSINL
jgi:hypothetical protein